MSGYRLVLTTDAGGQTCRDLDAGDLASALALAHHFGKGRPAQLWRGEKLLCHITEDAAAGFWTIA